MTLQKTSTGQTVESVCSITLNHDVPAIFVEWHGYATSAQMREIHETLIAIMAEHKFDKILGDDTLLPIVHADDQTWITSDWMPRAFAAGLRAIATKEPELHFGQIAVGHVHAQLKQMITLRDFNDLDAATRWLKSVER